tara:strand:- start:796 stop:972 length:177 start_codon:yes stop_codon:yes gene_type:complete
MQFPKNTRTGNNKTLIIKVVLILAIIIGALVILSKVDFPSPNKAIEKSIPNEKLKIVK